MLHKDTDDITLNNTEEDIDSLRIALKEERNKNLSLQDKLNKEKDARILLEATSSEKLEAVESKLRDLTEQFLMMKAKDHENKFSTLSPSLKIHLGNNDGGGVSLHHNHSHNHLHQSHSQP